MRRPLRALGRLVLVTVLCALLIPKPVARGGTVGYATEWTQLLNHVQLVDSYIRQGEELRQQIQMVLDMAKNTLELPSQVFGPIMDDINQLAGVVQGGRSLAYSMANLDAEFRSRFQGWGYRERAWFRDYKEWADTSLDTTLGTLKAAGMQGEQLRDEQAVLNELRSMARTSQGRMRALQVSNQIMEQQVQQLMKLRQLMLADLQSKQAFQAAQIQKEAAREAGSERFFRFGGRTGDGRGFEAGK